MPRDQHYRQAGAILSNVLGADAASELTAYRQSVEEVARLYELAEAYQNHVFSASADRTPGPRPDNKAA